MVFHYMGPEVLKGFDKYKYSSIDDSPLSVYVTHPFWNWTVQYCPRWVAPNLLTFSGFLILVFNFLLLSYYDWSFTAADHHALTGQVVIPNWVWLVCGVGTFLAHTLDGIDGKQARRTQSSTPLGELFDHGLDSWATLLLPGSFYSVFGRGQFGAHVFAFYLVLMVVMLSFILSHWEKYNTGVLYLPWTYDLSQVGITAIFLFQYILGSSWSRYDVPYINLTLANLGILIFAGSTAVLGLGVACYNVIQSYRNKSGHGRSLVECVRPIVPCILWFSLVTIWVMVSPSHILDTNPRILYILTGTVFSNITCRLIVNQMSQTRCDVFNSLVLPAFILIPMIVWCPSLHEHEAKLLHLYTVMVFLAHIHYGTNVVNQMANKFNIYVFSLDKPEQNGALHKQH